MSEGVVRKQRLGSLSGGDEVLFKERMVKGHGGNCGYYGGLTALQTLAYCVPSYSGQRGEQGSPLRGWGDCALGEARETWCLPMAF